MSLGWLTPGALFIGALILVPILAHLIQRNPTRKIQFGAMMLLRKLPEVTKRRRKIQDWLLLLLRILAISAIALVVTQPELRWLGIDPNLPTAKTMVIVLDNSLSMNQKISNPLYPAKNTAFLKAKEDAIERIQSSPEGSKYGIVSVGEEAVGWTDELLTDRSEALATLKDIQQTVGETDLLGGIKLARRLLLGEGGDVYVYTDEAGPNTIHVLKDEIQLLSDQKGSLYPQVVRSEEPQNVIVLSAKYGDGLEGGTLRYQLMNYGKEKKEVLCTTRLPDGTEIRNFVQTEPEGVAENFITVPRVADGGIGSIQVEDSSLELDNDFYFHLPRVGASRVLVVDGEPGVTTINSEVYFLERALAPFGAQNETLPDVVGPSGIQTLDSEVHRVVFLANVMEPAPIAAGMIDFVRNGGGLMISLGNNVSAERYNSSFAEIMPAKLRKIESLAQLGEEGKATAIPDLSQELFSPFIRGGALEFSSVRWRKIFSVQDVPADTTVLLSLENGMPLLLEKKVGKGRILLLLGTVDHAWGNLPLQAIFMPVVQRIVTYLGGASSLGGMRKMATIGELVEIDLPEGSTEVVLEGPKGSVGLRYNKGKAIFRPKHAGPYLLRSSGAPPIAQIAVNYSPEESDIRVSDELLAVASEVVPDRYIQKAALAPWLIWVVLVLFLLQALLSFAKRTPTDGENNES